jgi:hypothetical protein
MWSFLKSSGDINLIQAVDDHVEKNIGKIGPVLHEKASPMIHVDVNVVLADDRRPYHTLVTSGMAEMPMPVPREFDDGKFAELMICLPKEWPIDPVSFKDENFWWPIRVLKETARLPHRSKTWVHRGHTVINEDAKAYASGTRLCAVMLIEPRTVAEEGHMIRLGKKATARLWAIVPLYKEELEWKLKEGFEPLDRALRTFGINEIVDPKRANVSLSSNRLQ